MSYRWVFAEPDEKRVVADLQEKLGVPQTIAHLLALREICGYGEARDFFRPDLDMLHDPFLMKDMELASKRLSRAVRNREKILVYGDYDVDGTTATAILVLFLKQFGLDVSYYIPHRFKDGYGISESGIDYAEEIGATLIVSVDCGITAVREAELAKEKGIDLIICDHHTAGAELPDAVAVLDPKRPDCSYPFDGLSGAGVGFKLVQATVVDLGLDMATVHGYLDLVAISIASDIVPVVDENRILMREGLAQINNAPRPGIQSLLDVIKFGKGRVSATSIVFSIGPRINAAGRMGDAAAAVELMVADNQSDALKWAKQLDSINQKRRDTDSRTMEEAVAKIEREYTLEEISSMVLHDPDWHLGVVGIVASRLVDAYYRPVIMLSTVEGKVKGSARSIKGFNIYDALKECEDLLEQFGGHEFAAGLTMNPEHLDEFRRRLDLIAAKRLSENNFEPELRIDAPLNLNLVDLPFWKLLTQFEPFGPGNARPVFASRDVELAGLPTIVGDGHLKVRFRQNGSTPFDAIGFNMHEYLPLLRDHGDGRLDIAYVLEENHWRNQRTLQLHLKDIHLER